MTDLLDSNLIFSSLNDKIPVFLLDTVDSTNDEVKRKLSNASAPSFLVIANHQTNGRGRQGKSFYSPADTGIYMSLLTDVPAGSSHLVSITGRTSVAVARAIEHCCGISCGIKWVNDLYYDGKKVCGILVEARQTNSAGMIPLIIGIGINISTKKFPDTLPNAGNISANINRNLLIAQIVNELLPLITNLSDYSYLYEYRRRSIVIGNPIVFTENGHEYSAVAVSIENDGSLKVCLSDGSQKLLSSGEISLRVC